MLTRETVTDFSETFLRVWCVCIGRNVLSSQNINGLHVSGRSISGLFYL